MSFELYQIYYKEDQRSKLYPFAIPHYNESLTIYFENKVIADIVPKSTAENISVCSWKLADKSRRVYPITPEVLNGNYQVLSFTRNSGRHQMLALAGHWHTDFIPAITMLWERLGYKMPGDAKHPIYQNHHMSKATIYKAYVKDFLQPAIDLIEKDEELNAIMKKPSNYGKLSKDSDLKSVKAKLDMTDYPLCPFVLERCYSLWLTLHRIPVNYL